MDRVLIDTNILIYADDDKSAFHEKSNRILEDGLAGNYQLSISARSLLEYYRFMSSQIKGDSKKLGEILETCLFYIEHDSISILYDDEVTTQITFEIALEKDVFSGRIYDTNLYAISLQNDIDIIYTKNIKDFPNDSDVLIIDPTI